MDQHSLKAELLGTMKSRPATGAFQPSREDLVQPLEGPDSVAYGFCQGCGMVFEITTKGGQILQEDFALHAPDNPQEHYVHFTRCVSCDTMYRDPEVRAIPR